jgi:2-phosphosulfolactate phosphatase
MKINVTLSPLFVDELYFSGKTSVVIDVLRATTTIVTALNNGAREIIPVNSIEFAMKVSGDAFGGQTLLGGERNTKKIEGFNLGNSPREYTREVIGGKSVILFTTNGSKAIVKAKYSELLLICSFINVLAVASYLVKLDKDIEILCSGRNNNFSLEDTVCAGKLIAEIRKQNKKIELTDPAKTSLILSEIYSKNIVKMLNDSEHGKLLVDNGFTEDIDYCAEVGSITSIPYYTNGILKLLPASELMKLKDADPDGMNIQKNL